MKRLFTALLLLCFVTLPAACGGGGGGEGGGTSGRYALDPFPVPSGTATLSLAYEEALSSESEVTFSLVLSGVPADVDLSADVGGISGTLRFDSALLDFVGFAPDPSNVLAATLAVEQNAPGVLVIAVSGPQEGTLGTLAFQVAEAGTPTPLKLDQTAFIAPSGVLVSRAPLTGRGGTLTP